MGINVTYGHACAWACAFSISNPSIRKSDSTVSNIYILANSLSPALCDETSLHRPFEECIHGNACFVEKRTFPCENTCDVGKCVLCRETEKMRVSLENAHLVAKCLFRREKNMRNSFFISVIICPIQCKMPMFVGGKNADPLENAWFIAKCLFRRSARWPSMRKCMFECT